MIFFINKSVHDKILSLPCKGHTKFTTSAAHDVIAITLPQKNDLCTEEVNGRSVYHLTFSLVAKVLST